MRWAHCSASGHLVKKTMGPSEVINCSKSIRQWARANSSAAAAAYASGPMCSCVCQWARANSSASAVAYANGPMQIHWHQQPHMPMGPREFIGSSSRICQWAHANSSASAAAYANGSARIHRQQQPHMPAGPCEFIGISSSGPCKTVVRQLPFELWAAASPSALALHVPRNYARAFERAAIRRSTLISGNSPFTSRAHMGVLQN
jgi:hypothetical protein